MGYILLKKGGLAKLIELVDIDILAFLIAGSCHDVGHDGFNNAFHVNSVSERAVASNDVSVQESYHAAQTFRTLLQKKNNFLENLG